MTITTAQKQIHCPAIRAAAVVVRLYELIPCIGGGYIRALVVEACAQERTCSHLGRCPLRTADPA
ncbi:MAG: hypothetical protein RBS05_21235 [Zoogloea oleivorans]|jgi:hypothetical protein|uniref:hypothetical protein n=1 Tax=Zoogloea oleivorans TaxID=1552750 RepID=UPI002A3725E5|nr:hypothetical protein [Zoogloea oleivorans]MDY0038438.1 hypothetical protein [Zoogloea oleivorans]